MTAPDARPMAAPLRVGLVGAGPWASLFHATMLAGSDAIELVGVWARRPDQAEALAGNHGATAVADLDALFEMCEAVAFAVPPDVQARLAVRAADAGRHLLLEKPLGLDVAQARAVADAATANGVISQLVLTNRYRPSIRRFVSEAADFEAFGARAASISGTIAGDGLFATPWRIEHGALLDVGPHVLDLLDAVLGPIVEVRGAGDPTRWIEVTCTHAGGAVSQASLSIAAPVEPSVMRWELYGSGGVLACDAADSSEDFADAMAAIPAELAHAVRTGTPHPLDAARGLYLQELLAAALAHRSSLR